MDRSYSQLNIKLQILIQYIIHGRSFMPRFIKKKQDDRFQRWEIGIQQRAYLFLDPV
jgi:hypothetical protein